jgi:uncharacterized flavoprotein (TIGR03862 family)
MQIDVAVIGGGPAGLMAAEVLSQEGHIVHLFDAMPSLGRKFLMAGKSGLNLTHSEAIDPFLEKFGVASGDLRNSLLSFSPDNIRKWADDLGTETFVGSSGRVFPKSMKAAPLLRSWLRRLRAKGVTIHVRHKWVDWSADGALRFNTVEGPIKVNAKAVVFALGGGSWPQLGSDGSWVPTFKEHGFGVETLAPANCGFDVEWSKHFKDRFSGSPVKNLILTVGGRALPGEFIVAQGGVEGGGVYQHAAALRDEIELKGEAILYLDMKPDVSEEALRNKLFKPQGSRSFSTHLKKTTGLAGVKAALLRECAADQLGNAATLASAIKNLPLKLQAPRPLAEAISSAGGVGFQQLDECFMSTLEPGTFFVGEMLNWEAPTGGYLLSACMATGRTVGKAASAYLKREEEN